MGLIALLLSLKSNLLQFLLKLRKNPADKGREACCLLYLI